MDEPIWLLAAFLVGMNLGALLWYLLLATPEQRERVDAFMERHFL
jgi:hypothetical protein